MPSRSPPVRLGAFALLSLGLFLAAPVAPALPSAAPALAPPTADDCLVEDVAGIGLACRVGAGLFAPGGDLSGPLVHAHPDVAGDEAPADVVESVPSRAPRCVADPSTEYHTVLIYARAHNDANRYADVAPRLRDLAAQVNGVLHAAAQEHGAVRELKMQCTGGVPTVKEAVLPTSTSSASFSTIVNDLRDDGYTSVRIKYWVFYDDGSVCTCSGSAHLYPDDRLVADNRNNGGSYAKSMFAVMFGAETVRAFLHELSHTMGAVQHGAPHATGAGHCNDGRDYLCYNDGGPTAAYTTTACSAWTYDCGRDDYFHPSPPSGSWLAGHWNIGSTLNRFLATGGTGSPSPSPSPSPTSPPSPNPSPSPGNDAPIMKRLSCAHTSLAACAFRANDADSAGIYYTVAWGDGETDRYPRAGFVEPGKSAGITHRYGGPGDYLVVVRAHDDQGAVSGGRAVWHREP